MRRLNLLSAEASLVETNPIASPESRALDACYEILGARYTHEKNFGRCVRVAAIYLCACDTLIHGEGSRP